jgi:hypothetical protein
VYCEQQQITGCIDIPPLAVNAVRALDVIASDVPVQLDGVLLEVRLDMTKPEPAWSELASSLLDRFEAALVGESSDDVDALLDMMVTAAIDEEIPANLEEARASGGWDGGLFSQLDGTASATALRAPVRTWYQGGATRLDESALLEALLEPTQDVRGKAKLTPIAFATLPASDMGFPREALVAWVAEPNDKVLLGASFNWLPWLAFTRQAERRAALAIGVATTDVPSALATDIGCGAIAANLHERALSQMGDCDLECLTGVCESAVERLWNRANDAVVADAAWMELSATATATVDQNARPTSFLGEWVGTLDTGDQIATISGTAEGGIPAVVPDTE